ncbi:MAG TPA: S8 family peptidase [Gammaproteobacteria bacterium]
MLPGQQKYQHVRLLLLLTLAVVTTIGSVHDKKSGSPVKTVTISGAISVNRDSQTDSDVNDPFAPYLSNDSIPQAQQLKNPVTLGGFVAVPGSVPFGRLANGGSDVQDYYQIALVAQQILYFFPGDAIGPTGNPSTCKAFDAHILELCVALENANGDAVAVVADDSNPNFLTIAPQNSGNYYLRVQAEQGARNYILATGLPSTSALLPQAGGNDMNVEENFIPGDVIVKFKSNFFSVASVTSQGLAASVGLTVKAGAPGRSLLMSLGGASTRALALHTLGIAAVSQQADPERQLKQKTIAVVNALRGRADVEYAAPNYLRQPLREPDDTHYGLQWNYPKINLPLAWDMTTGVPEVVVAVIDSGVLNHPDLQASLLAGYDFISSTANSGDGDGIDNDPTDPGDSDGVTASSFHGTHVAGTVAAVTDNATGVAGVAWNVKVLPLRACGKLGCTDYDVQQALLYAAGLANDSGEILDQAVAVVNLSLGAPTSSTVAPPAYIAVRNAGVIVVAAAGNESSTALSAPAAYDGVVGVSAVDFASELAFYSNRGSTIDVAAPGGDMTANLNSDAYPDGILSTMGWDLSGTLELGYGFYQGTSMAAPHVAGVVALMKSVNPGMTPEQFDEWLATGDLTQDLGAAGRDDFYGHGLIDAAKAVSIANDTPIVTEPPPDPLILVAPDGLVFNTTTDTLQFAVSNGGQADLVIDSVTNDSGGWLTVSESAVDANGVGTYIATVDRSQMTDLAAAAAVISIAANATNSPRAIPVIVNNQAIARDAGFHYVRLIDADQERVVKTVAVGIVNGQYQYTFSGVPIGNYAVKAGNDANSDSVICGNGEACGAFAALGNVVPITVSSNSGNLTGVNFVTGFNPFITETAGLVTSTKQRQLLR